MCLVIARPSLRLWLVVLIALLVTLLGYLYVESWLSVGPSARSSLSRYALWFVRDFVRVNSVGRNAFYAILAVGVASVMGALLAFVGAFRSRDTARLHACAAAIAIALPALVFWLPNWVPTPRHFLLVAPIVAWFVATRLPRDAGRVRVVAIVCAVALANVLLPELVYGTYARFHPRHPKTPHGSFFAQHAVVRERAARFQRLGSDVEQGLEQPVPDDRPLTALVGWEAYGYLLYDLGAAGVAVQEPHVQRLAGGIELRTYRIRDHGVLHLLVADRQVWIADPGSMQRMLAHFASISSTAWVPREAIDDRMVSGLRPGLNAY